MHSVCVQCAVQCATESLSTGDILDSYSPASAVAWADAHAQDVQPFDAACTWFVSQALWAGGLAKTSAWTDAGSHSGYLQTRRGTVAATEANTLLAYLRDTYGGVEYEDITTNLTTNAVPDAQPGDIIAYDWDGHGTIDHIALVVSIAAGQYPVVAEWGAYPGGQALPYTSRGWTYSAKNNIWLQNERNQKNMRAYLLHFAALSGTF